MAGTLRPNRTGRFAALWSQVDQAAAWCAEANRPCPSCGWTVWGGCSCLTRYSEAEAEDTLPGVAPNQAPAHTGPCPCGIDRRDCEYHRG